MLHQKKKHLGEIRCCALIEGVYPIWKDIFYSNTLFLHFSFIEYKNIRFEAYLFNLANLIPLIRYVYNLNNKKSNQRESILAFHCLCDTKKSGFSVAITDVFCSMGRYCLSEETLKPRPQFNGASSLSFITFLTGYESNTYIYTYTHTYV